MFPETPARMVNVCATLGLYADSWFPKTEGAGYEASEYLALIDQHRDHYALISGLGHANQSGRQAHNSEITWLTSEEHPGLDGFRNTLSLDQAAAGNLGYVTRFPSIVLGTTSPQSQSYTESGVMVPAETSPAALFTKLFLQGDAEQGGKGNPALGGRRQHPRPSERGPRSVARRGERSRQAQARCLLRGGANGLS